MCFDASVRTPWGGKTDSYKSCGQAVSFACDRGEGREVKFLIYFVNRLIVMLLLVMPSGLLKRN